MWQSLRPISWDSSAKVLNSTWRGTTVGELLLLYSGNTHFPIFSWIPSRDQQFPKAQWWNMFWKFESWKFLMNMGQNCDSVHCYTCGHNTIWYSFNKIGWNSHFSSKTFIKNHFHQKTTFIKQFHQKNNFTNLGPQTLNPKHPNTQTPKHQNT